MWCADIEAESEEWELGEDEQEAERKKIDSVMGTSRELAPWHVEFFEIQKEILMVTGTIYDSPKYQARDAFGATQM